MKGYLKRIIPNRLIKRRLDHHAHNSVLLTFDDGPHPGLTPQVLELLKRYSARAVFFIVGHRAQNHPNILRTILSDGHLLGNHTFAHPNDRQFRFDEYRQDILRCQHLIHDLTGVTPHLFRPPLGRISPTGLRAARSVGLSSLFWSCEGGEWNINKGKTPSEIAEFILCNVHQRDIILLHDDNELIPDTLENILPRMREKGLDLANGINHTD